MYDQAFMKTHPGCKKGPIIDYEHNGATNHWNIDFEWKGYLYMVKEPSYFDLNPCWEGNNFAWSEWNKGDEIHKQQGVTIRWYLWEPMFEAAFPDYGPLENFRNTCRVGKSKSPYDAWYDYDTRFKAEENLAAQIGFGGHCLKNALRKSNNIIDSIIHRFTIAKIAPRVTSMSASQCNKLFQKYIPMLQKYGVYDPCGGFGGRKAFAELNNIKYESYDVNPILIKEVGHSFRDLIAMDSIETDRIVLTSPPWDDKEVWPGSNGSTSEIHPKQWWYDLIMKKVKAPGYIFVNGAMADEQKKSKTGLFGDRNNMITTYGCCAD